MIGSILILFSSSSIDFLFNSRISPPASLGVVDFCIDADINDGGDSDDSDSFSLVYAWDGLWDTCSACKICGLDR